MIKISKKNYKLPKKSIKFLLDNQIQSFEDEFDIHLDEEYINITYNQKSYSVNNKTQSILDSKVQAVSFFSGAGGLDIGTQLAGSKVISSLDFDEDSVKTMRNNKYFSHELQLQYHLAHHKIHSFLTPH